MRYDIATHKIIRIVVVMGLLLLGLILVRGAKELDLISSATKETLLIAIVVGFPLIIIALMQQVSNEN